MVNYYLGLCKAAWLRPHGRQTELPFAEEDMSAARAMLERAGVDTGHALFLLHPAAGFGPSKLWPEGQFAKLAEMLQSEFDAQVACIGSRETSETARRIVRMSRVRVVDLTDRGIDLHSLKCVVKLCRLLVTTDSGPRHYGVALGVPTVCLMGPTHPAYSASGLPHDHVVRVPVECGPCQRRVCRLDHRCMMRITPEMVLNACRQALSSQEREA
jgi:heptosyltransferase-2